MLKVIGAGMGRTGTESLRSALLQLGFSRCHHMYEIRDDQSLLTPWKGIATSGNLPNWHEVFEGFDAQTDWPGAAFWRELHEAFPNAKVVLTVRDVDAWHESILKTIAKKLKDRHLVSDSYVRERLEVANSLVNVGLFGGKIEDPSRAKAVFHQHVQDVTNTIEPERLLVFDVAEGWEPLCRFLELPEPSVPFPQRNSATGFALAEGRRV